MTTTSIEWRRLLPALVAVATFVAACSAACSKDTVPTTGGMPGDHPVSACSDPQPWTPPAAPSACANAAPSSPTTAAEVTIAVDAATTVRPWNRFYEKAVATDHAHTLLCTAYGRNIQNALRKAHAQAGFQYARFHGILDDDNGVYTEDAAGVPIYDWSAIDTIYDAVIAAGMRPIVEIGFTPNALASIPSRILTLLWYNNASPNISAPTGADDDWGKWIAFMAELVRHLDARYGADEVHSWYFEVWNEPSWMYAFSDNGYPELYRNTVAGLLQGDPEVRVGGPAGSSGESPSVIKTLITTSINTKTKLDFLTYHRYGDDDGLPVGDVDDAVAFHKTVLDVVDTTVVGGTKFTGEILNDEFGPSYMPHISRDSEVAASYITKVIHQLGSDPSAPPPASYGYWALSDLYEEIVTGSATAYRPGNYGLLLKGDPLIPESFDVAKPAFNAFRLLHMMGDQQLDVTGGTAGDGVGATATSSADGSTVQILVYNHVAGGQADPSQANVVALTLNGLPFAGPIRIREYIVDYGHANSYRAWLAMGSPPSPTQSQWVTLRDAAELCYYETTAQPAAGSATLAFSQNVYGVALFEITAL